MREFVHLTMMDFCLFCLRCLEPSVLMQRSKHTCFTAFVSYFENTEQLKRFHENIYENYFQILGHFTK
jgi:hypothetical protein